MTKKTLKVGIDAVIYAAAFILAYWLRFDGPPPSTSPNFMSQLWHMIGIVVVARLLSNYFLGVYRQIWSYISLNDVIVLVVANAVPSMALVLSRLFFPVSSHSFWVVPYGVTLIDLVLAIMGVLTVRVGRRIWFEKAAANGSRPKSRDENAKSNVILVGAGMAGIMVAREAKKRKELNWNLVGFIDDDPKKLNTSIYGLKVLGTTNEIPALVRKHNVSRAIITIANARSRDIRRIVQLCEAVPLHVKIVPGIFEILDDTVTIQKLREVRIDDLLGRDVVDLSQTSVSVGHHFQGKRVLVTGAGGSIGSEICRQLCNFSPAEILLIDKDENGLHEVESSLRFSHPHVPRKAIICDIRNMDRLCGFMIRWRPQIIFHAAAHKHVPLMEGNVVEAVTNNICGTLNLLNLAEQIKCETFVMLSTDKAVNPSSIMGATKRVAELMIQSFALKRTRFSCVRFGNVLGSKGSVVPLFQSQIKMGGPVTVTDKSITRFFMTIPESVQLVIQAATLGEKGEVYVLDMGKPIRITDLARDLIQLSGLSEDAVEIQYTGLRAGEKLYEELFYPYEKAHVTTFAKIIGLDPIEFDFALFWGKLDGILKTCHSAEDDTLRRAVFDIVNSCRPVSDVCRHRPQVSACLNG